MTTYNSRALQESYVISQDITAIQAEVQSKAYLDATVPVIDVAQHPSDYVTMTGVLEAVGNGPETAAEGFMDRGWGMALSMLAVFVGVVLIALGLVWNAPTTRLVWSILSGEPM